MMMKRLLLIFLVACGSTPPPTPKPLPPAEPRDTVVVTVPTPIPKQEYDTVPVIILYSDTLLKTGIYGVNAMDGYEVSTTPLTYIDTEKVPIYPSYMVWQAKRR
jgi:hypothetical protein